MANTKTYTRSFAGGELSSEMMGRIDDARYQSGAARLRNFITTPQGPAENRPGLEYVSATKNHGAVRLLPFTFSSDQTMVVEMGAGYFRFHTAGATLETTVVTGGTLQLTAPELWASQACVITETGVTIPGTMTVAEGDALVFESPSTLPFGLLVDTVYYAVNVATDGQSFQLSLTRGGSSVFRPPGALPASVLRASAVAGTNPTGIGASSVSPIDWPTVGARVWDNDLTTACQIPGGHRRYLWNYRLDDFTQTGFSAASARFSGFPALPAGTTALKLKATLSSTAGSDGSSPTLTYDFGGAPVAIPLPGSGSGTVEVVLSPSADTTTLGLNAAGTDAAETEPDLTDSSTLVSWGAGINITEAWLEATTPTPATGDTAAVLSRYYQPGDEVLSWDGADIRTLYRALLAVHGHAGTETDYWLLVSQDETVITTTVPYEVANPYAVEDLPAIHYVQSNDVLTLVHPNYPPAELRRLGATRWSYDRIRFVPSLLPPVTVSVTPSPGFLTHVASVSGTTITTAAAHTLALGDGVYLTGSSSADGFYLVAEVPIDGSGNLITNQLKLMDYSGALLDPAGFTSAVSLQLGGKVYDIHNYYVVTALDDGGVNESVVSAEAAAINNLNVAGSYNSLSWSAVTGAARYRIYKKRNGLFGFIGETDDTAFTDDNIAPDFSITPPHYESVFTGVNDYPGAVSYFQQRRVFAGTRRQPQNFWMTKSGTESNMSYSLPSTDSDRIAFAIASREANIIRHIVPLTQLLMLTSGAEIRVSPVNSDVITPSSTDARPQSYVGASEVQPVIVNNSLVYAAARGGHVRECGYNWQAQGFITGDLSLRAAHLFDNLTIIDQTFVKAPQPVVWFVSSSGKLLGLTYIPEEQVGAWHWHDTDGTFEAICAVIEGDEDRLYCVVKRTVNGATVRYIERLASRVIDENDSASWFFVDSGLSCTKETPATEFTGLDHLEGETVAILADGVVCAQQAVTAGKITLATAASKVIVGLPITADLQTLPVAMQIDGFGQGRTKNINRAWLRVTRSHSVWVGPDANHLMEARSTAAGLTTGTLEVMTSPNWQQDGTVFLRQRDPLPLTVVGLTLELSIGG